jgi:putative membrane protein
VGTGDLIFLQIQCEEPLLFVLACVWTGFVDTCVVYSLDAAFGDIGKAIAIFMLVLQVAGSGGTFPVQMLPQAFQTIYPYLPFVWSMTAMRECIGGLYANTYVLALARLACFIVPTLVIGLVIRPFSMRANAWIERQLHATKVM